VRGWLLSLWARWLGYQRSAVAAQNGHPERPIMPTGTWSAQGHSQWVIP
jgi:hypothetical protein